jgi:hypothetical protein
MSEPSTSLKNCTQQVDHTRITVRARNKTATFLNTEKTSINIVDLDCLIKNSNLQKADFVVAKPQVVDVIVELKGHDVGHAIEQIIATATLWKKIPPFSQKIGGLVVFSRSPERSASLDNTKLRLLKMGIWLEMGKSGVKEYQFETFTGARQ